MSTLRLNVGDRVRDLLYGEGVVVGFNRSRDVPEIEFDSGRKCCVIKHSLELVEGGEERHERLRQIRLKCDLVQLLIDGEYAQADEFWQENCSPWWSISDYRQLSSGVKRSDGFVLGFVTGSFLELDLVGAELGLSAYDIANLKLRKLAMRLAGLGVRLDPEQQLACTRSERHRLIRARAGSGKTHTLSTLAALIIRDEQLEPDQVLMLAFNTKAASEIGDRVRETAGVTAYRNARTFHGLAWRLADHAGRQLVFDDGGHQPSRRKQSQFMERVLKAILNPAFQTKLYEFFRRELEQLDRLGFNLKQEEYRAFRRAMTDFTLAGENVKSQGEKFIADFLFEHGIEYVYEKVYLWASKDRLQGSPYRPDFCISAGGRDLILEHWAIDPSDLRAQVPDWFKNTTTRDYREQVVAKRKFWLDRGVTLLETHTGMLKGGREAFETTLHALLSATGMTCRRLDHATLVRRVAEAPRTVSRMSELFLAFISRAKKRGWTVDEVSKTIGQHPDPEPRNRIFHGLGVRAYAEYERLLKAESSMDFDDLLKAATESVHKHGANARFHLDGKASIAIHELRWIMIDEFQDFSELYFRLIAAILAVNPDIRVVAVGDDWQAINGFAGAQLSFFNAFDTYFPGGGLAGISNNRRSGRIIVGAGNKIMEGLGEPACAHHDWNGMIAVQAVDKISVGSSEDDALCSQSAMRPGAKGAQHTDWDLAKALKACADFLVDATYHKGESHYMPSVLVLARTGYAYGLSLTEFGLHLRGILEQHPALQNLANAIELEVMTAHRAKGKEADTVIVLEATLRQFPKVHADNQLFGPFGVSMADTLAEERRLFYVAVTRAQHRLLLLTETGQESPYLEVLGLQRGARHLAALAKANKSELPAMGELAQAIEQRLDQLDRTTLIRHNVTPAAVPLMDRLMAAGLGQPEVPYFKDKLCAELAWPHAQPPVAVLTGHHAIHADAWQAFGWTVHKVD